MMSVTSVAVDAGNATTFPAAALQSVLLSEPAMQTGRPTSTWNPDDVRTQAVPTAAEQRAPAPLELEPVPGCSYTEVDQLVQQDTKVGDRLQADAKYGEMPNELQQAAKPLAAHLRCIWLAC